MKALGMLSIVSSLTGCGLLRKDQPLESSNIQRLTPLSKEQQLAQAFAKVDKKLAKEAAKVLKKIRDDWEKDRKLYLSSISRARKAVEKLFDHFNSIGLTDALDAYTVRFFLENYNGLDPQIIQSLKDEGFKEAEIWYVHDLVYKARNQLLPTASTIHMPQILAGIITKMKKVEEELQLSSVAHGFKAKTMMSLDKLLNCLSAALLLGNVGASVLMVCTGCAIPGNIFAPIACFACGVGLVSLLSAYDAYLDGCVA